MKNRDGDTGKIKNWMDVEELSEELMEDDEGTVEQEKEEEALLREPKSKKKLALLGIVLLCALVLGGFLLSDTFYGIIRRQSNYTLTPSGTEVEYSKEAASSFAVLGDLVLRLGQEGIAALDSSGKVVWDVPFTMTSPNMVTCGDYVAVADRKGTKIILCDKNGLQSEMTAEYPITLHTVNEAGYIAVAVGQDMQNGVALYSNTGELIVKRSTTVSGDGVPMAIALNEDATKMVTSYLVFSGESMKSQVTVFDFSNAADGVTDRILANYSYDATMVVTLAFIQGSCVFVGDNRIGAISMEGNTKEAWSQELLYTIKALAVGEDFFALAYDGGQAGTAQAEPEYDLVLFDKSGVTILQLQIGDITYLDVSNGILVYGQERSYKAISKDGTSQWYYDAPEDTYRLLNLAGGDTVTAVVSGKMKMMSIVGVEETGDSVS